MNWKDLVGSVAPVLGTALGGPFGGMAGKFLASSLGVNEAELPDKIETADPDTLIQIKNLDHDFKVKMKELGITEEQLHQKDRQSARSMAQSTSIAPQVVQSFMYDVAFILVCYYLFTAEMMFSDAQNAMINIVFGILSAGLVQVNNFWFGSSSGSKSKTTIMGGKQ